MDLTDCKKHLSWLFKAVLSIELTFSLDARIVAWIISSDGMYFVADGYNPSKIIFLEVQRENIDLNQKCSMKA